MSVKKKDQEATGAHMPRRGVCTKTTDGKHDPRVVVREISHVFRRMTFWPNLSVGIHVREQVECQFCGKRAMSDTVIVDNDELKKVYAMGDHPALPNRIHRMR